MLQTIQAVFDGQVLIPENGVELVRGERYRLHLEPIKAHVRKDETAWDVLKNIIGKVEGPEDWASQIDHYLYGIPKRNQDQ